METVFPLTVEAKITSSIAITQDNGHTACKITANTHKTVDSYMAALINPPPHINPRLAAHCYSVL